MITDEVHKPVFRCCVCYGVDAPGCDRQDCPNRDPLSAVKTWQERIRGTGAITEVNPIGLAMQAEIDDLRALIAVQQKALAAAAASWTDAASAPDDDILVLLEFADGEVWPGYRDADTWRDTDAMPIEAGRVTGWKHMPPGRTKGLSKVAP